MKDKALKAWNWLVTSSANPDQLALTVKAGLPFVVLAAGLFKIQLNEGDLSALVYQGATALTGLVALYGLCRKIYLTARG